MGGAAHGYRVWAPHADSIGLWIDDRQQPMYQDHHGWWHSRQRARDGERYGYLVDGHGPFPDPRSHFQPDGVHGLSQRIDHARFRWTDQRWQAPPLAAAIIYELHVGTFSEAGTFAGVRSKLSELADLGVTHLELMPVAEFPGNRGWGYDGVHLFAPHHPYGSPDDLKALVDACHAHGLAVILDVVYNHLGPSGNYLHRFGPYFTDRYRTPWGEAVNLDGPFSDEVRTLLRDNARMWLEDYHFDGLRLDAVHTLIDTSARHLLEQLAEDVDRLAAELGRHLVLIAESDLNDARLVRSRAAGGFGLAAQWSDDFHHALHAVLTGERSGYYEDFGSLAHLARAFTSPFVYAGHYSRHRRRVHGRDADGAPGWQFVACTQNHDQIGNRAQGERLSGLISIDRLEIAAALLLCSPYVPLLFQGEEWAASTPFQYFTAHEDEELGRLVSEGRRQEFAAFGWASTAVPDPQHLDTYRRSRLVWDERHHARHAAVRDWYRRLIALRRARPALRDGNYAAVAVSFDERARHFIVQRGDITIAVNLSADDTTLSLHDAGDVLLASNDAIAVRDNGILLPPDSVVILGPL